MYTFRIKLPPQFLVPFRSCFGKRLGKINSVCCMRTIVHNDVCFGSFAVRSIVRIYHNIRKVDNFILLIYYTYKMVRRINCTLLIILYILYIYVWHSIHFLGLCVHSRDDDVRWDEKNCRKRMQWRKMRREKMAQNRFFLYFYSTMQNEQPGTVLRTNGSYLDARIRTKFCIMLSGNWESW